MLFVDRVVDVKFVAQCLIWFAITVYVLFFWIYFHTFSFNFNISGSHSVWYEFFTMLGGLGAFLSPVAAAATIAFLYAQHKEGLASQESALADEIDFQHRAAKKAEYLLELKDCSNAIIKTLEEPVRVDEILTFYFLYEDQFYKRRTSVSLNNGTYLLTIDGYTGSIADMDSYLGFLSIASRLNKCMDSNCFDYEGDKTDSFQVRLGVLKERLSYLISVCNECESLRVDNRIIRHYVSVLERAVNLLHDNKGLTSEVYTEYQRLTA